MTHKLEILVELYKRGRYDLMPFFQKQIEALELLEDDVITEVLYGGAARGGKSWVGCCWQMLRRLAYKCSAGLIARNEFSKLQVTTMATFFKAAKWLGLENGVDFKYNGQTHVCHFMNGSLIHFSEIKYVTTDPEFDRLGSFDLTDCFLDEVQQMHEKAISVLKGRFSVLKGENWELSQPKALYSCNPKRNWIYKDFVKPAKEGTIANYRAFISALATDNPTVPQSYIENLKRADKITRERLLYGNFEYEDDDRALCDYDSILDCFTNTHVNKGEIRQLSTDIAMQGRDNFITAIRSGGRIKITNVLAIADGKTILETIESEQHKYGVGNSQTVADIVGVGAFLTGFVKNIKKFNNGAVPGDKKQFKKLRDECGKYLADSINRRELYIICEEKYINIIAEELYAALKRKNLGKDEKFELVSKEDVKQSIGRSPDFFDTINQFGIFDTKSTIKLKVE